jgi:hypothetical protein
MTGAPVIAAFDIAAEGRGVTVANSDASFFCRLPRAP